MKNILVITYSQSGQLDSIVESVLSSINGKANIFYEKIKPKPDFPFPWKDTTFWDAMPESVEMIPSKIEPLSIDMSIKYDLVILGYPIWFLSPPIPLTTFLKSKEAELIINNKPIITIIGSRNMWVVAQEDIKRMIKGNNGRLVGNISLRDRHHNLPSVITIIHWMISGRKDRLWGIFPKPGISDRDIDEADRFGPTILSALENSQFDDLQEKLLEQKSVEIVPSVLSIEKKGKKIFRIWSKLILKKGGPGNIARESRLRIFKWYLLFAIFIVSPIVTLFYYITYPLFFILINKEIKYFKGVELKKQR